MAQKKNNYREFFIIRSETVLYAIATDVIEAEGFRKHFNMPFDVWGPIAARSYDEVYSIALLDLKLRPSKRMAGIYKRHPLMRTVVKIKSEKR